MSGGATWRMKENNVKRRGRRASGEVWNLGFYSEFFREG